MTLKTAPSVWATIVGKSVVWVRDSTRRRPSHASHTTKPSAIAVPTIQRSVMSRPGQVHRGWRSRDRKSTRLNSSHLVISYAVFCLKKKKKKQNHDHAND